MEKTCRSTGVKEVGSMENTIIAGGRGRPNNANRDLEVLDLSLELVLDTNS
jgi:hypothetical protein